MSKAFGSAGVVGFYWSLRADTYNHVALYLTFANYGVYPTDGEFTRAYGLPLRCLAS